MNQSQNSGITHYEDVQVDAVRSDLKFHPANAAAARVLAAEQIEHYNRAGYIADIALFSETETEAIRTYFDGLLTEVLATGKSSYSIGSAHLTYGRIYDLLTDARIVSRAVDIIGPNTIGWGAHFFCKMPGDGKTVSWHQDASYWPMTPSKTVTVWLAIDDADLENACMRFIPGSHHYGHLTWRLSEEDEHNVLDQTVEHAEELGDPVDVELRAGHISMHSDLLLHGSNANQSERRRCGLTLRYCAADVVASQGWDRKGVVVHGRDQQRHWANPCRPQRD